MRNVDGLDLSHHPRGEGAVRVAAHELLALVVPGYRPEGFIRLPPELRRLRLQVPEYDLARLVAYQHLRTRDKIAELATRCEL